MAEDTQEATHEVASSAPAEELTEQDKFNLMNHGALFLQLLESEQFKVYLNTHFDIMRDEEEKRLYVIEVPPQVVEQRVQEYIKQMAQQDSGLSAPSLEDIRRFGK